MVSERYQAEVGVQFVPAQADSGIGNEVQRIMREAQAAAQAAGGILDLRTADAFGDRLGQAIRRAVSQDLNQSELFQALRKKDQARLKGLDLPPESGRFLQSQLQLSLAERAREMVAARAARQPGAKGTREVTLDSTGEKYLARSYADVATRTQAIESAEKRYAAAVDAANRAVRNFIEEMNKAAAAAEKQAAADAADQVRRREFAAARNFRVDFPNAAQNPNVRLGNAQEQVNIAQRRLAVAEDARAQVLLSGTATATQLQGVEIALSTATRGLATARLAVEREEIRAGTAARKLIEANERAALAADIDARRRGSFGSQFALGFRGVGERPYAEQLGQAFKFSLFYGTAYKLLFAFTETLQQTLTEGIEFQNAVTELQLATGQARDEAEKLANQLGESASQFGFAPSQGALIAARAQGFYGTTQSPADVQAAVGRVSAEVVSQLAFASGKQAVDLQGDLAAVAQAFGLGPQSQRYIGDLDAYFSRRFGAAPGQTVGAVSQAATVGRAAGFTPAELQAFAASIVARTGASDAAAGGYLAQIFSRAGEGSLVNLNARYGIDSRQDFAEQFRELARIYAERPDQRDDISAVFGRGKVQNAVIALLQDFEKVQDALDRARTEARGELKRASDLRLSDIGGQLQQLQGALREFANDLGQSGLLDALGASVVLFREIVEAGGGLLELFSLLPGEMRLVASALAALAVAARLAAASESAKTAGGLVPLVAQRAGTGFFRSAGGAYGPGVTAAAGTAMVAGPRGAFPIASRAGAATALRGGIAALGGYAAAGAGIGLAVLIEQIRQVNQGYEDAAAAASNFRKESEQLGTVESFEARASEAEGLAAALRESQSGRLAGVKNLGRDRREALAEAARIEREADRLRQAAADQAARDASADPRIAAISGLDAETLSSDLDRLTAAGATARQRLDALRDAIGGVGAESDRAAKNIDPRAVAQSEAQSIYEALLGTGTDTFTTKTRPNLGGQILNKQFGFDLIGTENTTEQLLAGIFDPTEIQARLTGGLKDIPNFLNASNDELVAVAERVVGDYVDRIGEETDFSDEDLDTIRQALVERVRNELAALKLELAQVSEFATLTRAEALSAVSALVAETQARLNTTSDNAFGQRIRISSNLVRDIRNAISKQKDGPGSVPENLLQLRLAQQALAQAIFARSDAARASAQYFAETEAEARQIGRRALRRDIRTAVEGRDPELLAKVIGQAGDESIRIARRTIQSTIATIKAARDLAKREFALVQGLAGSDFAANFPDLKPLRQLLQALSTSIPAGEDNVYTGDDLTGASKAVEEGETALDREVARRQAEAIRRQGRIEPAKADIFAAKAAMQQAEKGSVAYYQALGEFYSARQELTSAIIEYRQNLFLLGNDATNPLTQARAAVRAAAQQLRANQRSGAAPDQIAADRLALQQAQAEAESTKFNQRLEAVQTADDLGRISHQSYLNYLDREKERLESIKNRTYQQQQQLNQIDRLIKEATETMQGQWNFGDIKLPTPYEVKRRVQELYGTGVRGPLADSLYANGPQGPRREGGTNIYIDGADIGKIKEVLRETLGNQAYRTTTAARKR